YYFDYNYGNLNESILEMLRLWPTDEQISQTIKYSHQLALIISTNNEEQDESNKSNEISISVAINKASFDSEFQYGSEDSLDFEILLQQQQRHEAYTSRSLERKFKMPSARFNTTMTIYPNKANHIVAYFSKNENPKQRLVKQSQIHARELVQLKKHKSIKKQKSLFK
ncbi:34734_t:CDS:2, partial [Gigaspora margarita]